MIQCKMCKCSCDDKMLHRTNPKGQTDAGWMCMDCIEKHEQELAKNLKSEKHFFVLKDIEEILLGKPIK